MLVQIQKFGMIHINVGQTVAVCDLATLGTKFKQALRDAM